MKRAASWSARRCHLILCPLRTCGLGERKARRWGILSARSAQSRSFANGATSALSAFFPFSLPPGSELDEVAVSRFWALWPRASLRRLQARARSSANWKRALGAPRTHSRSLTLNALLGLAVKRTHYSQVWPASEDSYGRTQLMCKAVILLRDRPLLSLHQNKTVMQVPTCYLWR